MNLSVNPIRLLLIFIAIFLLVQCQKDQLVPDTVIVTPMNNPLDTITPDGTENYLTLDSDYIFDQSKLPTFELDIPMDNLAQLNADPAAEEYVTASLTFEDETIGPVGVRYKGSIGAYVGCLSGDTWWNPSGYKTCTKLSMKIKINWEGRDEKFYGLKKLQLHSMNLDPTQMRDRLGYWLFAQMGVPTPRAVHARLMINGEFAGLFILVEEVDSRFSRYHFEDGTGNVYKEIWPLTEEGIPHHDTKFRDALRSNENDDPSFDIIRGIAQDIEQATDDIELKVAVEKWMDIDQTISYAMVDRMIRHDDGPFHWYCGYVCSPHNFYWVEEPNNQKLNLIPWDLDNAFEGITNSNIVTRIPDAWGETSNNCLPYSMNAFGLQQRSAACDKLVYGMTLFTDEYEELKQQFIEGPFSEQSIATQLSIWSNQIKESTLEAQARFDDALSESEWNEALDLLKEQCSIARSQ